MRYLNANSIGNLVHYSVANILVQLQMVSEGTQIHCSHGGKLNSTLQTSLMNRHLFKEIYAERLNINNSNTSRNNENAPSRKQINTFADRMSRLSATKRS